MVETTRHFDQSSAPKSTLWFLGIVSSKLCCQEWLSEGLKLVNNCQVVEEGSSGWVSRSWGRGDSAACVFPKPDHIFLSPA